MKPVLRRAFPSSNFININLNANFGSKNTLAKILLFNDFSAEGVIQLLKK